jgi:hypothetical protein
MLLLGQGDIVSLSTDDDVKAAAEQAVGMDPGGRDEVRMCLLSLLRAGL